MDFSTFTQNQEVNRLLNLVMYHYNLQKYAPLSLVLSGQAAEQIQQQQEPEEYLRINNEIKNVTFITHNSAIFDWFKTISNYIIEAQVFLFKDNIYLQFASGNQEPVIILIIDVYLSPTPITIVNVGKYDCQLENQIPSFLL